MVLYDVDGAAVARLFFFSLRGRAAAHGSCSLFGLTAFHSQCRELELSAEQNRRTVQSGLIAQLRQSYETARPELQKLMGALK